MSITQYLRGVLGTLALLVSASAIAIPFTFTTGDPDGLLASASRADTGGLLEIESADDFILDETTRLDTVSITGLVPTAFSLGDIGEVRIEIYRLFPLDSLDPPSGRVPERVNSPADNTFVERDLTSGQLSFALSVLDSTFTADQSVINDINAIPNQTTGGEGPVNGQAVRLDIDLITPILLPADHYFLVPQIDLTGGDFLWLSAARTAAFTPDLQSWIRDENLAPDWLRIGTDIIGAGAFNASFSISGETLAVSVPGSLALWAIGLLALLSVPRVRQRLIDQQRTRL